MELRTLRYFATLAEELHFGRAAQRLAITQPPLSRQIAALEAALGVLLLERDTRAVRLTAAGEAALHEFGGLLQRFDDGIARVVAAHPAVRRALRVGVPWWADLTGFASFEQALLKATGIRTVEPVVGQTIESMAQLRRGEIAATMLVLPCRTDGLRLHPIARVPHVALVPSSHPLARRRALRLRDLEVLPAFLRFRRRDNPLLYDHFSALYQARGFRPPREEAAQGTVATLSQIAAGRGCTVPSATSCGKFDSTASLADSSMRRLAAVPAPGEPKPMHPPVVSVKYVASADNPHHTGCRNIVPRSKSTPLSAVRVRIVGTLPPAMVPWSESSAMFSRNSSSVRVV